MSDDTYVPPEVDNLGEAVETVKETGSKGKESKAAVAPPQPKMEEDPSIIGIGRMVNAKGTAATALIVDRIDRHLKYLSGDQGFKDDAARIDEQTTFIESIGNTLKLPFEQYVVVTDHLLQVIRNNKGIFADGTAFRFTRNLKKDYPLEAVNQYRNYMTMLSMIASQWSRRHKLNTLVDITYLIKDLPRVGKENVTQYFNNLMKV